MGVIIPPMKMSNFVRPAISKWPNTPLRIFHQYSASNNLILTTSSFIHTSNSNSWSGTSRATAPEAEDMDKSPETVEKWFKQLPHMKEKMTKLRFYLHETNGGIYGKTIYQVAQPNISSPTNFGKISMFDDPLKVGKDPESQVVGTAQGSTGSSSLTESSLLMALHFVFTSGKYNDSTLSVIGRNPLMNQYREFAVVGGSGAFRLAKGIATAETASMDPATHDLIIEYNVIVIHYDTPSATVSKDTDIVPSPEVYSSYVM